jgi:hypothetical protein
MDVLCIFLCSICLLVTAALSRWDVLAGPSLFETGNGATVVRWRSMTRLGLGVFVVNAVLFSICMMLGDSFHIFFLLGPLACDVGMTLLRLWFDWRRYS